VKVFTNPRLHSRPELVLNEGRGALSRLRSEASPRFDVTKFKDPTPFFLKRGLDPPRFPPSHEVVAYVGSSWILLLKLFRGVSPASSRFNGGRSLLKNHPILGKKS
jgi:hypothetical protein